MSGTFLIDSDVTTAAAVCNSVDRQASSDHDGDG